MADGLISATRRRNVSPISSIIKPDLTRDADCSLMTYTPEDGQFILVNDTVGSTAAAVYHAATAAAVTATDRQGAALRMIWGSAEHTDRRSSGQTRVPHFNAQVDVATNLYIAPNTSAVLSHADNFPANTILSVANAATVDAAFTLQGSGARLVLQRMAEGDCGWAVGYVLSSPAENPASGKCINVRLYDAPRYVGHRAAIAAGDIA